MLIEATITTVTKDKKQNELIAIKIGSELDKQESLIADFTLYKDESENI